MKFRKIDVVYYDVTAGNSRVKEDSAIIEDGNELEYQRLIAGFVRKYGSANVLVEDGIITILRVRL